jgi:TonB family protein
LAAFSAMPDYSFAPASKNAPVTGGNSSSSYVSILYGMIFSRIHQTKFYGGEVNFIIDYSGRLVRARVIKSSGSPEADAAVIAAIRAASPFPPSPIGIELSMVLHY